MKQIIAGEDVGGAALDVLGGIGGDLAGDLGGVVEDAVDAGIDAGLDAIGVGGGQGTAVENEEAVAVVGEDAQEAV